MRHNWTFACRWVALLVLALQAGRALAVEPSENLLPDTTKGYISITNVDQFTEQWDKTSLGKLLQDPVMKPFADDLRRQAADRLWGLRRRLGASLDDLDGLAGGEAAVAFVHPAEDRAAVVLLVDVTDRYDEARAFLKKVAANMAEQKATGTPTQLLDVPAMLYELPPAEDDPAPGPSRTVYVYKDDLLAACDDVEVMTAILRRQAGQGEKPLAELPAFRAVMDRCGKDALGQKPQFRWFIEPFGYGRASRAVTPEDQQLRRGKPLLEQLAAAGFDGVEGIGGYVDLALDRYELLHRTAVYAPKPHEKSMKMLVFPNVGQMSPPAWVPREVATYTVLYIDLLGAFDHFGPLFDEVVGEGAPGIWEDTLTSLREDPDGPQIGLRAELFEHLDKELIALSDYELPITVSSERLLYAIKVKDAEAVAKALRKTQSSNKEVRRREFQGHVIWETVIREEADVERVEIDAPPIGFGPEEEEAAMEEAPPLLPHMSVCVANGYLLIASHYDFLVRMLEPREERESLARSVDFRIVESMLASLTPVDTCLRGFSRTDEEYRAAYELLRQGKMPESETMLGRVLNDLLGEGTQTTRAQELDASQAPEFDFVRRHLGPAGTFATSEEDGWFFKGFMLGKEAE